MIIVSCFFLIFLSYEVYVHQLIHKHMLYYLIKMFIFGFYLVFAQFDNIVI